MIPPILSHFLIETKIGFPRTYHCHQDIIHQKAHGSIQGRIFVKILFKLIVIVRKIVKLPFILSIQPFLHSSSSKSNANNLSIETLTCPSFSFKTRCSRDRSLILLCSTDACYLPEREIFPTIVGQTTD